MAFKNIKSVLLVGLRGKALLRPSSVAAVQSANLTRDLKAKLAEDEIKTFKPWPYEKPGYNYNSFWEMVEYTVKYINENSKIICVEGNIGVGKNELARKLASEFDLKYMPDIPFNKAVQFKHLDQNDSEAIDGRVFNEMLSEDNKFYGLEEFYSDSNPNKYKNIGKSQCDLYKLRWHNYADAVVHLLNTGQGTVLPRSAYSECVFVRAMEQAGYMTKEGAHWYMEMLRKNTICELKKPHLIIYMDAPVSHIQQNIKKRNNPIEVNTNVLSDKYLQTIEDTYKNEYLPEMEKYSEIITVDASKPIDINEIVYNIENLDLDKPNYEDFDRKDKFYDWHLSTEDKWNFIRINFSREKWRESFFLQLSLPWEADELITKHKQYDERTHVLREGPGQKYAKGYNPEEEGFMKLLFKP